jgi:hypothetical protein
MGYLIDPQYCGHAEERNEKNIMFGARFVCQRGHTTYLYWGHDAFILGTHNALILGTQ